MVNKLSSVLGYQGDWQIIMYFRLFSPGQWFSAQTTFVISDHWVKWDQNSISDILAPNKKPLENLESAY